MRRMLDEMSEYDPYAPPREHDVVPVEAPYRAPGELPKAVRIAGALLLVNGALVLLEKVVLSSKITGGSPVNGVLPVIFDVVIGVSLIKGNPKFRTWAIVRCVLGAILFSGIQIAAGQPVAVVIQLMVSGSLLALLVGDASKPRTALACGVFGIYVLLELIGLSQ